MASHMPSGGRYYTELPEMEEIEGDKEIFVLDEGYGARLSLEALVEACNKLLSNNFTEANPYYVDEYCIFEGSLYRFIEDKEPGEWDASIVEETNICKELMKKEEK